jgi:uncharacterized protein (TIGR02246 family)
LTLFSVAAFALAAGGCQKQGASANSDPAAVQNAIKADEQKWNQQIKSKDVAGLVGHYADDAYLVTPGGTASGSTAINKIYSDALADNYFSLSFASDKIDVSGDLAYSRGHFSEKYQDPKSKQIVSDSGSYLTVYKKQQDGSWKAIEDFASADPATRKETSPVVKGPKMISF